MFGNSELKKTKSKLEKALNLAANQIFILDPATRSLTLKSFKETIKARYIYDKTTYQPPFSADEKESAEILEIIVKKVEDLIKDERYEGENFNAGLFPTITENQDYLIWEKITNIVKGFYPDKEEVENVDDDLLANVSKEKSLELRASQVISELNEDDDPYIGEIDDEELEEESNINLEFGISGCPIDSEAFSTAIYVRILGRDMVSIQEERNRISAATRYVAHLIELFSKESFYENNEDFEKNKFLNTLINLKNETTNILSLMKFVLENIDECFELFHIGRTKFDKRGYQTDYESNDEFLENLNFAEVISMISGAWEDSLDSKKWKR